MWLPSARTGFRRLISWLAVQKPKGRLIALRICLGRGVFVRAAVGCGRRGCTPTFRAPVDETYICHTCNCRLSSGAPLGRPNRQPAKGNASSFRADCCKRVKQGFFAGIAPRSGAPGNQFDQWTLFAGLHSVCVVTRDDRPSWPRFRNHRFRTDSLGLFFARGSR